MNNFIAKFCLLTFILSITTFSGSNAWSINWPSSFDLSFVSDYHFTWTGSGLSSSEDSFYMYWWTGSDWDTGPAACLSWSSTQITWVWEGSVPWPGYFDTAYKIKICADFISQDCVESSSAFLYIRLPTVTSVSPTSMPLSGGLFTLTGTYFMNGNSCTSIIFSGSNYYGVKFGSSSTVTAVTVSCSPTTLVVNVPSWGESASGSIIAYLKYPERDAWYYWAGGYQSMQFVYPSITSVSRSTLPLSGGTVTVTGNYFGTSASWYTYLAIGSPSLMTATPSTHFTSITNTQIVVNFPSVCSVSSHSAQTLYLGWGSVSYTSLSSAISIQNPALTSCSTSPISSGGQAITLVGTNLGTACSFYTYFEGGGKVSNTCNSVSDTTTVWVMPSGGSGHNVNGYLAWCSGPYTTCVSCLYFQ